MKLTWFGETTFRIYLGGKIIAVTDGATPTGVDVNEVNAGADLVLDPAANSLPEFVAENRKPLRLIDKPEGEGPRAFSFQGGLALVDLAEPPVFIVSQPDVVWDRTFDGGVVVLTGPESAAQALAMFAGSRPKLLALALEDISDADFASIAAHAGQTTVQLLEPSLALEA